MEVDGHIQQPSDMEHFSDSDVHQDSEIEICIDEDSQVNTWHDFGLGVPGSVVGRTKHFSTLTVTAKERNNVNKYRVWQKEWTA